MVQSATIESSNDYMYAELHEIQFVVIGRNTAYRSALSQ